MAPGCTLHNIVGKRARYLKNLIETWATDMCCMLQLVNQKLYWPLACRIWTEELKKNVKNVFKEAFLFILLLLLFL